MLGEAQCLDVTAVGRVEPRRDAADKLRAEALAVVMPLMRHGARALDVADDLARFRQAGEIVGKDEILDQRAAGRQALAGNLDRVAGLRGGLVPQIGAAQADARHRYERRRLAQLGRDANQDAAHEGDVVERAR